MNDEMASVLATLLPGFVYIFLVVSSITSCMNIPEGPSASIESLLQTLTTGTAPDYRLEHVGVVATPLPALSMSLSTEKMSEFVVIGCERGAM